MKKLRSCAVRAGVGGLWSLKGGRGRRTVGKGPWCRRAPLPGRPFAEAAVRARLPRTMRPKHKLGCVGGAGTELAHPPSQQVPLFTALAGLAASLYHGEKKPLLLMS